MNSLFWNKIRNFLLFLWHKKIPIKKFYQQARVNCNSTCLIPELCLMYIGFCSLEVCQYWEFLSVSCPYVSKNVFVLFTFGRYRVWVSNSGGFSAVSQMDYLQNVTSFVHLISVNWIKNVISQYRGIRQVLIPQVLMDWSLMVGLILEAQLL